MRNPSYSLSPLEATGEMACKFVFVKVIALFVKQVDTNFGWKLNTINKKFTCGHERSQILNDLEKAIVERSPIIWIALFQRVA